MDQERGWILDFERRSNALWQAEMIKADKLKFGRELASRGNAELRDLAPVGLWLDGEVIEFRGWSEGLLRLGARSGRLEELASMAFRDAEVEDFFVAWRKGSDLDRSRELSGAWAMFEAGLGQSIVSRGASMEPQARRSAAELLCAMGSQRKEWGEQMLRKGEAPAKPAPYGDRLLDFFFRRIRELRSAGLLPAVSSFDLKWIQGPLGGPVSYPMGVEDCQDRPSKRFIHCRLEWITECKPISTMPALGLHSALMNQRASTGFDFSPGVGPGSCFEAGGRIHRLWIKALGAQSAMAKDWSGFEQRLAGAHAWLLADAVSKGAEFAVASAQRMELQGGLEQEGLRALRPMRL